MLCYSHAVVYVFVPERNTVTVLFYSVNATVYQVQGPNLASACCYNCLFASFASTFHRTAGIDIDMLVVVSFRLEVDSPRELSQDL